MIGKILAGGEEDEDIDPFIYSFRRWLQSACGCRAEHQGFCGEQKQRGRCRNGAHLLQRGVEWGNDVEAGKDPFRWRVGGAMKEREKTAVR